MTAKSTTYKRRSRRPPFVFPRSLLGRGTLGGSEIYVRSVALYVVACVYVLSRIFLSLLLFSPYLFPHDWVSVPSAHVLCALEDPPSEQHLCSPDFPARQVRAASLHVSASRMVIPES